MSETVRVAVDAMGGDNAPGEIVKGAVEADSGRERYQSISGRQTGCCQC